MNSFVSPLERDAGFSEKIYRQLRNALMRGRLAPGHRLVHRTLALEFEVSPTPVREALLRLAAESAVIVDQRGIAFVPLLEPATYAEILGLRLTLEGRAAAAACQKPNPALANAFSEIHERMAEARRASDFGVLLAENERFHFGIIEAASMPVLGQLVENLWVRCGPALRYLMPHEQMLPTHPHLDFIEAIRNGSPERGRDAMTRDIESGGKIILRTLAELANMPASSVKQLKKPPKDLRSAGA